MTQKLYCLLFILQLLDTPTGSKMDLFEYMDKYGKVLICLNI